MAIAYAQTADPYWTNILTELNNILASSKADLRPAETLIDSIDVSKAPPENVMDGEIYLLRADSFVGVEYEPYKKTAILRYELVGKEMFVNLCFDAETKLFLTPARSSCANMRLKKTVEDYSVHLSNRNP